MAGGWDFHLNKQKNWLSLCQKFSEFRKVVTNNFAQFFETRCSTRSTFGMKYDLTEIEISAWGGVYYLSTVHSSFVTFYNCGILLKTLVYVPVYEK